MWRTAVLIFTFAICTAAGCAGKQDYHVYSADQRELLLQKAVAVEGRVIESRRTLRPTANQYLFFFIPTGVSIKNPRFDATIAVDRVLKGQVSSKTIELRDYRPMTAEERSLFVDGAGIRNHLVLRIGYDRRSGNRFTGLAIVPIGNTPEFDAALRSFPQPPQ